MEGSLLKLVMREVAMRGGICPGKKDITSSSSKSSNSKIFWMLGQ